MVDVIIIKNADEETIKRILNGTKTTKEEQEPEPETKISEIIHKKPYKGTNKHKRSKIAWTKEELRILKDYYISGNPDWKLLQQLLPNRTPSAVKWKASQMRLVKKYSNSKDTKKPKKGSKWTKQEDDILREYYSKEGRVKINKIKKLIPHRTKGSIMVRACELKLTNKKRHWGKQKKTIKSKKPKRKVSRKQVEKGLKAIEKYHKFIKQRSIAYQKQGYNEPDSKRMAMADYQSFKNKPIREPTIQPTREQKKAVVPENFPIFETITGTFQTLIESITKHIIANKGTKPSYLNSKDILDISDGRAWHDFVAEFMTKSQRISEYFNVPNKFKHIREQDKYDVIVYEA